MTAARCDDVTPSESTNDGTIRVQTLSLRLKFNPCTQRHNSTQLDVELR